jgi:hypothetical protein
VTTIRTSSKPVCLLDIDGVINSLLKQPPTQGWPKDAWRTALYTQGVFEFPLLWSTPVVEYLTGLHEQGRVEFRWHTTWQETAPEFGKIVGLPEFGVQDAPEARANQGLFIKQQILNHEPHWWKYPAAKHVLTVEKRPLIWIDDDIELKLFPKHRQGLGALGKACLVSPDGQTGLLSKHMRKIEEFLLLTEEAEGALSSS